MPSGVYVRTKPVWNKGKKLSQKHKENLSKSHIGIQAGPKHPMWKGGKYTDKHRYIFVYKPEHPFRNRSDCVREHRLVVEKYLGRYLLPKEFCHHINRIRNDNRLENLIVFTNNGAHLKFEAGKKVKSSDIIFDGRKL